MDSKKKNLTVCILFGLLLAVAFLACLFLPKEATSDSERRKLAAMPAFTLDTVLSGQFIDFENCDVLFLYSSLVLNNSDTLK